MTPMTENWKSPLALLVAVLALYFASLKIDVRRAANAAPQAPVSAPAADPAGADAVSNEIDEFQQLG
jgi:hypothetical protein